MRFDVMTLFPQYCDMVLSESVIGRARKNGHITVNFHNIRDYSENKHRNVDDTPYGGGKGMLMAAPPVYNCYRAVCDSAKEGYRPYVVYMSPQGKPLTQQTAARLSLFSHVVVLCGHYEGIDARVINEIVDEEISIGDYVLTGGELPACILIDCVSRLCPGVLSADECFEKESHTNGLLEYPQYTRPYDFNGIKVPDVLLSGHHENIEKWRYEASLEVTRRKRPDLWEKFMAEQEEPKKIKK